LTGWTVSPDNRRRYRHGDREMAVVFVARSQGLSKWGADVGVTKNLFKVGVASGTAEEALKAMNENGCAGERDWKLLAKLAVDGADEATALARLGARDKPLDPSLYPRLKGERSIFKIKPESVENHLMVKKALAGDENIVIKIKPADIGAYLIANAIG
jgi:hypothetical protein